MTSDKPQATNPKPGTKSGKKREEEQPGWADGLRKLYDSVVDEPLPDSFKDLLAKLDDEKPGKKA